MDNLTITKVTEFSPHVETVPSDDGDWASMQSSAVLEMRDELPTEEAGVAFVSDTYDHQYQARTTLSYRTMQKIQDEVGLFDQYTPDANGVVESADVFKYTVEAEIRSFVRTVVDGAQNQLRLHEAEITAEYREHDSLDCYEILVKWSRAE